MSGWGLVDGKTRATQLQAVQVEVLPDKECTNRFSHQISILPKSYFDNIISKHLLNVMFSLMMVKNPTPFTKSYLGGMCMQEIKKMKW